MSLYTVKSTNRSLSSDPWDLVALYEMVVYDFFNYDPEEGSYLPNKIFIDLDSALSILLTNPLPESKDDRKEIIYNTVVKIARFLEIWKNMTEINIYWSFKETKLFNKYIPEWCENRNKRLLEDASVTLIRKAIIDRLNKVAKAISNVKVIECNDSTIISIARDLKMEADEGDGCLVMSRDPHYNCLFRFLPNIEIFNAKTHYTSDTLRKQPKAMDISYILYPYVYTLMGMSRNDYKGKNKWGAFKSTAYVTAHADDILNNKDEILQEMGMQQKVFLLEDIL